MEQDVAREMMRLSLRVRWQLFDIFEDVAARPFAIPDRRVSRGDTWINVRSITGWQIKYWVDHSACQVVILEASAEEP